MNIKVCLLAGLCLLSACGGDSANQDNNPLPINSNTINTLIGTIDGDSQVGQAKVRFNSNGWGLATWRVYTGIKAVSLFSVYDPNNQSWSEQQLLLNSKQSLQDIAVTNSTFAVVYHERDVGWKLAELVEQNGVWNLVNLDIAPDVFNGMVHMAAVNNHIMVAWGEQTAQAQPVEIYYAIHDGVAWLRNTTAPNLNNKVVDLRTAGNEFVVSTEKLDVGGSTAGGQSIYDLATSTWTHSPGTGTSILGMETMFDHDTDGICFLRRHDIAGGYSELNLMVYTKVNGWIAEQTLPDSLEFPRINGVRSQHARVAKYGNSCFVAWHTSTALLVRVYDIGNANWLGLDTIVNNKDSFDMLATDTHVALLISGITSSLEWYDGNSWSSHDPAAVDLTGTGLVRTSSGLLRTSDRLFMVNPNIDPFMRNEREADHGVLNADAYYEYGVRENDIYVSQQSNTGTVTEHILDGFYAVSSERPRIVSGPSGFMALWSQFNYSNPTLGRSVFAAHVNNGQRSAIKKINRSEEVSVFSHPDGFSLVTGKPTGIGNDIVSDQYKNGNWLTEKTLTSGVAPFKVEGTDVVCWYRIGFVSPDSVISYYCANFVNGELSNEQKVYEQLNQIPYILGSTTVGGKAVVLMLNSNLDAVVIWHDGTSWQSKIEQHPELSQLNQPIVDLAAVDENRFLTVWTSAPNVENIYWAEFSLETTNWAPTQNMQSQIRQNHRLLVLNDTIYLIERGVRNTLPYGELIHRYDAGSFTYLANPIVNARHRISDSTVFGNAIYMTWEEDGKFALRRFDGQNLSDTVYLDYPGHNILFPVLSSSATSLDANMLVSDANVEGRYDVLVRQKIQ